MPHGNNNYLRNGNGYRSIVRYLFDAEVVKANRLALLLIV